MMPALLKFSCVAALGPVAAMAGGDEPFAIREISLCGSQQQSRNSLIGEGFFFEG